MVIHIVMYKHHKLYNMYILTNNILFYNYVHFNKI